MSINKANGKIRLTNAIREEMLNTIVKVQYAGKTDEDYMKQIHALSVEFYNEKFDKKTRAKMERLPEGWLRKCSYIEVEMAGWHTETHYRNGNQSHYADFPKGVEKLFPHTDRVLRLEINHPQNKKFRGIHAANAKAREGRQGAIGAARETLSLCRTLKQLNERWPDAVQFVPEWVYTPASYLPTVPIIELNKMLGINKNED